MARVISLLAAMLAVAMLQPRPAFAETYPARPIKIIAGTLAGGQSDRIARLVGQDLEKLWNVPIVIENRAGADGTIAGELVAHAPPDGYTLLLAGQSNLVLVTAQGRSLRYDAVKDFAPIGRVAGVPLVLAVNARLPATDIAQLIVLARVRPGALTYGSTGIQSRLAAELLKATEHLDILEIPCKGVPPAVADLLSGRIDLLFCDLSVAAPMPKPEP